MKLEKNTKEKIRYFEILHVSNPFCEINWKRNGNQISYDGYYNDGDDDEVIEERHYCYHAVTLDFEPLVENFIKEYAKENGIGSYVFEIKRLNEKEVLFGYICLDDFTLSSNNKMLFNHIVWEFSLAREIEPDKKIFKKLKGKDSYVDGYGRVCYDGPSKYVPSNLSVNELESMFEKLCIGLSTKYNVSKYVK